MEFAKLELILLILMLGINFFLAYMIIRMKQALQKFQQNIQDFHQDISTYQAQYIDRMLASYQQQIDGINETDGSDRSDGSDGTDGTND